jgi:hypothetical protein
MNFEISPTLSIINHEQYGHLTSKTIFPFCMNKSLSQ